MILGLEQSHFLAYISFYYGLFAFTLCLLLRVWHSDCALFVSDPAASNDVARSEDRFFQLSQTHTLNPFFRANLRNMQIFSVSQKKFAKREQFAMKICIIIEYTEAT